MGIRVETTDADPSSIVVDDRATTLVSFSELELESLIDPAITDTEISESDRTSLAKLARYVVDEVLAAIDRPSPAEHPYRPRHPFVSRTVERTIVRRVCQCAASHAWSRYLDMAPRLPQNAIAARSVRAMICSQNVLVGVLDEYADLNAPSHRALRAQVLDRLLNGEPAGELAKRYSVRLASCYVVAALADGPEEHGLIDRLLYRADLFVATADDHHVLLMPAADGILRREAKELAQRILRGANDSQAGSTIAVSIATEHPRIPAAIEEVRAVLRLTNSLGSPAGSYAADDLPMEMALLRSPDLATMLAVRLIPLHNSGAPLVDTLRTYLEHSQDRRHASRALHIHPNTLDYRLRRIRELTGLAPTVPRDIQTLGASLIAWRLTGMDEA